MINRHTNEESEEGEGVEVIRNEPCYDEEHGDGQITEKRIHLNRFSLIYILSEQVSNSLLIFKAVQP